MQNETLEQLYKASKNMSAPLGDLSKAFAEICQRTIQQNLEIMSGNFSRTSEHLKRLSRARKPEDFISVQKEALNENMAAGIENIQKMLHTATENMQELSSLCSSHIATASKDAKDNIK